MTTGTSVRELERTTMSPPSRRRRRVTSRRATVVSLVLGLCLAVLVAAPIVAMFYGATQTTLLPSERSFTLDAVKTVYATVPYLKTLFGTLGMAIAVAFLSSILGSAFAWLLTRTDIPFKRLIEMVIIAPLFISPFIGAVAWVTLGAPNSGMLNVLATDLLGVRGPVIDVMNMWGVIWVMTLYYTPYGYLFVSAVLRNMDPSLEEASSLNGAGVLRTLRKVTLPLAWPAVGSAFFFIAVLATGIFSVPGILGAQADFVPMAVRLYRAVDGYPADFAVASAIGTILFWFTLLGIWLYRRSVRLSHRYVTVTARGFRPRLISLGRSRWVAFWFCVFFGLVAVVLPYASLILVLSRPIRLLTYQTCV